MPSKRPLANGAPKPPLPLMARALDAAGRLLPISDEERQARLPLELASLRKAWDFPGDEIDGADVWDEVLRNLGVDPDTGRGLKS